MPISNGTKERVGVEVSGPTHARVGQVVTFIAGAGVGTGFTGLLVGDTVISLVGLTIAAVSALLLWLIRYGHTLHRVLKPGEDLREIEDFDDLLVDFYQVDTSEVFRAQIAQANFTREYSEVTYFLSEHPAVTGSPPPPLSSAATHVRIFGSAPSSYSVSVS